ncbi:MAG TPA: hypothetical protein VIR58_15130 [Acidimicrobiales bacterium]
MDDESLSWRMRRSRRRARIVAIIMAMALLVPIVASAANAIGG